MVIPLSLLAGILTYCSFPPVGWWWCAPLGLALLLRLLERDSLKHRVLAVALFGTGFFGPLLSWTNTYVGDTPWLILMALQIILILPLAFMRTSSANRNPMKTVFLFPSLWVLIEFVRAHFPFQGFGWGRLAFAQASAPFAGLVRIGGAPMVSFTVALIGVGLYLLLQRELTRAALIAVIVLCLCASVDITQPKLPTRTFSFLAVQGGVPELGLDFNARATAVFENHLNETNAYLSTHKSMPDVIVWSENSIDVDPFKDAIVRQQLQQLSDKYKVDLIVGAVLKKGANFQNASILWLPRTGSSSIYIKRHLTPFGEYIPLRGIAQIVSPYAKNVIDFVPGHVLVVHQIGKARIAPIICFELLDDAAQRTMANASNLFVVQTNSATFGLSAESAQQLAITRLRAIEHQRYTISVSTSGISALIDPRGRVTHQTGQNTAAVFADKVGLSTYTSPADRYGGQVEAILILLGPVEEILRKARRKRRMHL